MRFMMFWILIAVMTAGAALSVLVPMRRARRAEADGAPEHSADAAVYRQQLTEVDRDLERGLIDAQAAEAARTEIARRLLAADDLGRQRHDNSVREGFASKGVTVLALIGVPVAALAVYLAFGSPDLPDQPLQARLTAPAENQPVEVLIARVERHLAQNPQDGEGWRILAPVYMRVGNIQAAVSSYANAIRILGPTADLEADYGEALTALNNGIVSAEAHAAFERAVALQANAVKPRFFLALALEQEGKTADAVDAWKALLDGADPGEAWVSVARAQLESLTGEPSLDEPQSTSDLPGPSADDVAAVQDMNAQDRDAMIASMVEGLAGRLETEGGSALEWLRLIRAYTVLGEQDKAAGAIQVARNTFAEDAQVLEQINELAKAAGLEGS